MFSTITNYWNNMTDYLKSKINRDEEKRIAGGSSKKKRTMKSRRKCKKSRSTRYITASP